MNPIKYDISMEEKTFYSDNGYLVLRNLFDLKSLDVLRQRFIDVCNGKVDSKNMSIIKETDLVSTKSNAEDYINKVQDILHDEVFMSYSEDPRLLHIVSQFIGEELTALNSMLINKPPGTTRHPPHQDLYYFPIRPANIIASWTAIDPSDKDNGCLYFIPGSHKHGLLPHGAFTDSKKFFHVVMNEEQYVPVDQRLYLELNPGDTVLFQPCTIHGSEANLSKRYRKSMVVHYMNSSCHFIDLTRTLQESVLHDYKYKCRGLACRLTIRNCGN